jgi:hypothetical protein
MRTSLKTLFVVVAVVASAAATFAISGAAARKMRCDLDPFSYEMPPVMDTGGATAKAIMAEWTTRGTTDADCGGTALLGIDVWEHAIVMFPQGGGPVRGRVMGFMVWNGETVSHAAHVRGTATCDGNACTLDLQVRGHAPNGGKLMLEERASLMLGDDDPLVSLDVLRGSFFDVFPEVP